MEVFNAAAPGAFNILRKYLAENEKEIEVPVKGISDPIVIKAAVSSFHKTAVKVAWPHPGAIQPLAVSA